MTHSGACRETLAEDVVQELLTLAGIPLQGVHEGEGRQYQHVLPHKIYNERQAEGTFSTALYNTGNCVYVQLSLCWLTYWCKTSAVALLHPCAGSL